jgi:hypothetical protein
MLARNIQHEDKFKIGATYISLHKTVKARPSCEETLSMNTAWLGQSRCRSRYEQKNRGELSRADNSHVPTSELAKFLSRTRPTSVKSKEKRKLEGNPIAENSSRRDIPSEACRSELLIFPSRRSVSIKMTDTMQKCHLTSNFRICLKAKFRAPDPRHSTSARSDPSGRSLIARSASPSVRP